MWHMHDVGWGWWFVMSIGWVAFWGLFIYAVAMLVRGPERPEASPPAQEEPERILQRRLASGEISVEEYQELRDALDRPPVTAA
jgi:putative membrane protein